MHRYFVLPINAEPWAIGPLSVARRGGKPYAFIGPNHKLQAYQEALKEAIGKADTLDGEIELRLYVWRKLEEMNISGGRNRRAHVADATNIQKATEDALQGVVFGNDRLVRRVTTEVVEQDEHTVPCIVVHVGPYRTGQVVLPDDIWAKIEMVTKEQLVVVDTEPVRPVNTEDFF